MAAEERALRSVVMQFDANTGHPSNDSLARAIRVTGGSPRCIEISPNLIVRFARRINDRYRACQEGSDWTGTSTTPSEWTTLPWPSAR
eukprot:4123884-Pyramimonas_sp.AAC.1